MKAFSSAALISLLALQMPGAAHAQPAKKEGRLAVAHTLYEQATLAMDSKDYENACPKLEEVVRLVPEGLGAKMTLAECYEAMGKLATAWSHYATLEQAAGAAGQKERSQKAAARAAALKPKLATLTIDVPQVAYSLPKLSVQRDEIDLGEAQWGVSIPIDAGEHVITASAPGYLPYQRTQTISDGEQIKVLIALTPVGQSDSISIATPEPIPEDSKTIRPWQKPLSIAFMALGGAGLVAGGILGGLTISRYNASVRDNHCDINNACDSTGLEFRNQAIAMGNGSTAAFIAGGVLSAAGVILLFTAPSSATTQASARPRISSPIQGRVELAPHGIRWIGSF